MAVIADVVIVAALLTGIVLGARNGLLQSLAGVIVTVVAFLGAVWLANRFAEPVAQWLRPILEQSPIAAIFCTGKKSFSLYNRYIRPVTGREAFCLPSTSPANCRNQNLETLTDAYRALLSFLG